jgi:hypothetical protein
MSCWALGRPFPFQLVASLSLKNKCNINALVSRAPTRTLLPYARAQRIQQRYRKGAAFASERHFASLLPSFQLPFTVSPKQFQLGRCRMVHLRWQSLTEFMLMLACSCIASFPSTAAAAFPLAAVDPEIGIDSAACGIGMPCNTIAYAVHVINASVITLAAGVFREPSISISNVMSLVISGVASATIFSCIDRPQTTGPVFIIINSTVTITGVTFKNCVSPVSNGGALSASGSSIVVSHCRFVNCSAASGGAISVMGHSGLFLRVHSSDFEGNSAIGDASGCPKDAAQPCSTWGGAIATFDIPNVTISGCTMASNVARASVPYTSPQRNSSRNALAGGGCVSVLFFGNASGVLLHVVGNSFLRCQVVLSDNNDVAVGNGTPQFSPIC